MAVTQPDLEAVYREHASGVFAFAFQMLGDREAALDVVQEAFAIALERRNAFRGEANPATWITGIARNLCLRQIGRGRDRTFEDFEALIDAHGRPPRELASEAERRFYEAEVREGCLVGLLQCLSASQRCVFVLHILNDLSMAEIATAMGISQNAARVHLSRARARMRRFLCANCALMSGSRCVCANMIDFSLDRGLIGRYGADAEAIADELKRFTSEVDLYRSLPDPAPEIARALASRRFAIFQPA